MLLCYRCRRLSRPQDNCEHCGAELPGRRAPPKIQVKTALLNRLSLEYRGGDIDLAALTCRIDAELQTARSLLEQAQDAAFPPEQLPFVAEELKLGRQGLSAYLEALELFRGWVHTLDAGELKRVLALTAQADTFLNQAVELNYVSYKTYLESMGEYLHQSGYQGPATS
ncbi:MAG: hypothetical protein AB1758_20610 [Candidatus Eremiobacterota bacterium]